MMHGKKILLLTCICCLIYGTTVHAETKTIEIPSNENVNLISLSDELNETYSINNDTYLFSFNGNTIQLEKDNPTVLINGEQQFIETETIEDITLPKYTTLTVAKDNVTFPCEKFLEITKYQINEKGIEINLENPYKIPEQTDVKNLDISYVKEHWNELGYTKENLNTYVYKIFGTTYHTIVFTNNGIEMRINKGKEYENNYSINNLAVETLFKCIDSENASSLYNLYLDGKNIEKNMENMKLNITFSDTETILTIQVK